MKFNRFTLLVLLSLLLALAACKVAEAIEEIEPTLEAELKADLIEEILSTEFSSATDQFSLRHPADWVVEEDAGANVLVMGNSEAALERFNAGQAEPGDFAMNIGFIPAAFFEEGAFAALDIQLRTTPDAFLQSIMPMLRLTGDNVEGTAVSEGELVSLSDDVEAGLLILSNEERDGIFIVFEAAGGVFAFVTAAGYPGEGGDLQEIASAIAATLDYTSSAEDLMVTFYGN